MSRTKATRIDRLTPAQTARFPEFVERWVRDGLCTKPADRPAAEAAMARAYEQGGVSWHGHVVWTTSPLALVLTDAVLQNLTKVGRDRVWASVGAGVRDSVGAGVRESVGAGVWASVWDSVNMFRQSDWLAVYDYFHEVCGLAVCDRLDGLMRLQQSAGWWIARQNVALICERPAWIDRDTRGRLHSETRQSFCYPDGWGDYSWHGVQVPSHVILQPEALTVASIVNEPNVEIRRIMIQRMGQERYLHEAGAVEVHRDDWGILYRVMRHGDTPILMVKVVNATPEPDGSYHDFFLRVPPACRTAHEAVSWTFAVPEGEYILAQAS